MKIQKNIQSNYGEWLGYVGVQPISESGSWVRVATAERFIENIFRAASINRQGEIEQIEEDRSYTEYDGADIPREAYESNPEYFLSGRFAE